MATTYTFWKDYIVSLMSSTINTLEVPEGCGVMSILSIRERGLLRKRPASHLRLSAADTPTGTGAVFPRRGLTTLGGWGGPPRGAFKLLGIPCGYISNQTDYEEVRAHRSYCIEPGQTLCEESRLGNPGGTTVTLALLFHGALL